MMKKISSLITGLLCLLSFGIQAQTADEIIQQHIEANGGEKKLSALKTVRMIGSMDMEGEEMALTISIAHLKGIRIDMKVMDTENYQIANPVAGISYMPVMGMSDPAEMTNEEFGMLKEQMNLQSPLLDYEEKGTTVEYAGLNEMDNGILAHKLTLLQADGKKLEYYIDKVSGHLVKLVQFVEIDGAEVQIENSYADYRRNEDGYWLPYSSTSMQGTIIFSKIETNIKLADALFIK